MKEETFFIEENNGKGRALQLEFTPENKELIVKILDTLGRIESILWDIRENDKNN